MSTAYLNKPPTDIDGLRRDFATLAGADGNLCNGHQAEEIRRDNNLRASWAARAVLHYADFTMGGASGEECEMVISDLLGDMMHLADALDVNFDQLVERARGHYIPELVGEL